MTTDTPLNACPLCAAADDCMCFSEDLKRELAASKAEVEMLKRELDAWDYGTRAKREQEARKKAEAQLTQCQSQSHGMARRVVEAEMKLEAVGFPIQAGLAVDEIIDVLERNKLGWSLDHTGHLIEARIWRWPVVIGRHRPNRVVPLAQMLIKAIEDSGLILLFHSAKIDSETLPSNKDTIPQ